MRPLSIKKINDKSPYKVALKGESSYAFTTAQGVEYEIGFIEDYMLGIDDVYQFFIAVRGDQKPKSNDSKVAETVFAVMEEFFSDGNLILDYVCDTSDGRQAARSRLFAYWYNSHPLRIGFTQRTIMASYDGVSYFAAVIVRNDNPRFSECMAAIDSFTENMADKLR